ncbi:MAG: PAS domain S-box protein [Proteobacteria bacterium]|nr:MAG: PAS domain S-box protein [Pseudomonadota bacterium]
MAMTTRPHFQQIIESAIDFAIIATGLKGLVIDWNSGVQNVFGWTCEERVGRSVECIFTPEDKDLGYGALQAKDSVSGLKLLQSGACIDLLATDVGLPGGMNGRQMVDAARVRRPDLKVLFITGYAETSVLGHGQLAFGMHVLIKPFRFETLISTVKKLIEDSDPGHEHTPLASI